MTTATFAGVTLTNTSGIGFPEAIGTTSPSVVLYVHESNWGAIEGVLKEPSELRINDTVWSNLYALREVPSPHPYVRGFIVQDVRWKWEREIIIRSMNIPRKTGNKRLASDGSNLVIPLEVDQSIDIYQYAWASLDKGKKWRPKRAVEDVMGEIARKCGHAHEVRDLPITEGGGVTIEGLEMGESAASALNRLLAMVPRAFVKVTRDGTAVVFDGSNRSLTEDVMAAAGPATVAGQIDRLIDLAPIRPGKIHVYFAKEVEIRFDSVAENNAATTIPRRYADDEQQSDASSLMENVVPLPDPLTTIGDKKYSQGTYVPMGAAIAVWNTELSNLQKKIDPPPLTFANIRKHWFWLEALYTPIGDLTLAGAKASWVARIEAIKQHYRRTWQIPRPWRVRMRDIKSHRVGVLDPVTGARAKLQAWSQYTAEPTTKGYMLADLQQDADKQFMWMGVDDYPGINADLTTRPSPAVVEIRDKDLGVIHLNYMGDPYRRRSEIHPSLMRDPDGKLQGITRDLRDQLRKVICTDGKVTGAAPIGLADDFRVALIVTAMPFMPNNEGRYYKLTVSPGQIAGDLKSHFQVTGGKGPDWHIVVPPSMMTAWYGHQTTVEARASVQRLFGFTKEDGPVQTVPGYRIMNLDESPGPGILPAMAKAIAVSQWAQFISQREGTRAVHLQPDLEVDGTIHSVSHSLDPSGRLITRIGMPSARIPISPTALLTPSIRPFVFGTIPDGAP